MLDLNEIRQLSNVAEKLDERELAEIGHQVLNGYKIDDESRAEWSEIVDKAMSIAKQTMEKKDHPWPNASNVKYPLITRASIDYAARTMPEIIQNYRIVKANTIGADQKDDKFKRAERVSQFMSYQLMVESPDWEDGTDKLLQILPVLGTVFKKTYYSPLEKRIISELCVPDKIVVNYGVQSLETARRITHILSLYKNDIIERQRSGLFLESIDVDMLHPSNGFEDVDSPIELLEQHCWLDLDEDGYKEPYVVTVDKQSGKVFRIVHRFDKISRNADKKITSITPVHYFTDYHFIRSPDGGFYSIGFGSLLLPLNSAINTLINQLIDSGTMSNMQGGFLGRGLRLRDGEFKFKMGEWKVLDTASGVDIKQNVFPLPVREPSSTLFSLLSLLMQIGQDLSSTNDAMMGKQPAQNVATGTLNQLVEQGTKVFTAINKRVYRSLKKEYEKIYALTGKYISNTLYQKVLDEEADIKKDFELDTLDICPIADPTLSTDNQRMSRVSVVQQLRTINPREADILTLQSLHFDQATIEKLLPPIDPNAPPPPEALKIQAEIQKIQAEVAQISAQATLTAEQNAMQASSTKQANAESEARIQEAIMRSWKMQQDVLATRQKLEIVIAKLQNQSEKDRASLQHQIMKDSAEIAVKADANRIKAQVEESKKKDEDNKE